MGKNPQSRRICYLVLALTGFGMPPLYFPGPYSESPSRYVPGGFHPVHLGDIFRERYHVIHRLGSGGYGTTWLVRDEVRKRFACLKVCAAHSSSSEIAILRHLRDSMQREDARGSDSIMQLWDDFEVEGPNGHHHCIVTELLGPSLSSLSHDYTFRVPLDVGKLLARDVASGIAFLHSCGVIHGDLTLNNILLKIPGVDLLTQEDIIRYFGRPVCLPIKRTDGQPLSPEDVAHLPSYQVAIDPGDRQELLDLCLETTPSLAIIDFGQSLKWFGEPISCSLGIPPSYAPPEILLQDALLPKGEVTPGVDIWALATVIHKILSGSAPVFCSDHSADKDLVLQEIVSQLGQLPQRWWTCWKGRLDSYESLPGLVWVPNLSSEDTVYLEDLFRKILVYEPLKRLPASKIATALAWWTDEWVWLPPIPGAYNVWFDYI
ncbi:hypothetical protein CVT26_012137 [Gymnopilus dilepis]|uniref:non-specific serine/threonine protein kinase n=1 Tax=Gymnopilus dilepis TaxID=231916 RepID=A0A409YI44_9AGAR|nr:hypothetical protein CVT26_012137 [Gymnopilus dilepis]